MHVVILIMVDTICTYMDRYMQPVINIGSIVYECNFQVYVIILVSRVQGR